MNYEIAQFGLVCLLFIAVLAMSVVAIDCALFDSGQTGTQRGWQHWVKLLLVCAIYLSNIQIFSLIGEPIEPFLSQALADCYAAIAGYSFEPRGYMDQCKEGCSLARWVCLGAL
jgi:hypothetical protein